MKLIRWASGYVSAIKLSFIVGITLEVLSVIAELGSVWIQKIVIDDIFIKAQYDLIVPVATGLIVLVTLYFGLHAIAFIVLCKNEAHFQSAIAGDLMFSYYGMPTEKYQNKRIAEMTGYFSNEIRKVSNFLSYDLAGGMVSVVKSLALILFIAYSHAYILLIIFAFAILYIIVGKTLAPRMKKASKDVQMSLAEVKVSYEEGISSSREVVAFHRMKWEMDRFVRMFQQYYAKVMAEGKLVNKQLFLGDPIHWGANLLILGVGGYSVLKGNLSLGTFVITYQFASQLMGSLNNVYIYTMSLFSDIASAERVKEAIQGEKLVQGEKPLEGRIRTLRLEKVNFGYASGGNPILKNVSLDVAIGQTIALVGSSGSGKSTIAQLLVRLFEANSGSIAVNGVPLREIRNADWRARVAVVFQEPYLFPDTIGSNLLMGRSGVSEDELRKACETAQIDRFIQELPAGFQTEIGERGVTLSGGQRQRLAIARALLQQPEILILDEATSALDLETERQFQRALEESRAGQTTILIAHRLSTIQNADVIYVLEQGEIVEQGTHSQLMSHGGAYWRLIDAQIRNEAV